MSSSSEVHHPNYFTFWNQRINVIGHLMPAGASPAAPLLQLFVAVAAFRLLDHFFLASNCIPEKEEQHEVITPHTAAPEIEG